MSSSEEKKGRRKLEEDDCDSDLCPAPKKRKLNRPRMTFMNITSKSAKHLYKMTFETAKANSLIFPDEIIQIVLSYLHIYTLYLTREDQYFKQVTDIKIKSNPNYLYEIFTLSTEIENLCQLAKYDPLWFKSNILNKINVQFDLHIFREYIENCLNHRNCYDDSESIPISSYPVSHIYST